MKFAPARLYAHLCRSVVVRATTATPAAQQAAVAIPAFFLVLHSVFGASEAQAETGLFRDACHKVLGRMIEQSFGALVAGAAGLGAIISAAAGGFKAAWSLLVVSVSCYILRAYLNLLFDNENCTQGL